MILGVTGTTGSGKSYLCHMLASIYDEVQWLDCDKIYHELISKGFPCWNELIDEFGEEILNIEGEIDRIQLSKIVFNDRDKLDKLNKITHKYVTDAISISLLIRDQYNFTIIDAPLLFQAGIDKWCDYIYITEAPESLRLERIMERDRISKERALQRIKAQNFIYPTGNNIAVVNTDREITQEYLEQIMKDLREKNGKIF